MKRVTVSLDDDLYRIAKSYAQSQDLSMSKAIVCMLHRVTNFGGGLEPGLGVSRKKMGGSQYRDPLTGLAVSENLSPITEADVLRARDTEDQPLPIVESFRGLPS